MSLEPRPYRRFTRRHFLRLAAGATLTVALTPKMILAHTHGHKGKKKKGQTKRWSDPATWKGKVPGPKSNVVINDRILLDVDASVASVVIRDGGELIFERDHSRRLTSTGNVVVYGKLTMRPDDPGVKHRITFPGIDEKRFEGGGMEVKQNDVGLWVMGMGILDLQGSPKLHYGRASGPITAGQTTLLLDRDPVGWQVGDEVAITPTEPPWVADHFGRYDVRKIASIQGRQIKLASGCSYAHPLATIPPDQHTGFSGATYGPEVLNLTRNCNVEGTPGGRTHLFIHAMVPQQIRYAAFRHFGPQKDGNVVLGRWGVHFHHAQDGARGSLVEGVVMRDAGSHSFVSHASHGITWRDCIAHNVVTAPYWWDTKHQENLPPEETTSFDIVYEGCVASAVHPIPGTAGIRMGAFTLQMGTGAIRRCVAVGVSGALPEKEDTQTFTLISSGYDWFPGNRGHWEFEDNLAHNCRGAGMFGWWNDATIRPPIRRFTAYHVGVGMMWGAYLNHQRFEDCVVYQPTTACIASSALSGSGDKQISKVPITYDRVLCDGGKYGVFFMTDNKPGQQVPVQFRDLTLRNQTDRQVKVVSSNQKNTMTADFVSCAFQGPQERWFWINDGATPKTLLRIQNDGQAFDLARKDQPGTYRPEWNARVRGGSGGGTAQGSTSAGGIGLPTSALSGLNT